MIFAHICLKNAVLSILHILEDKIQDQLREYKTDHIIEKSKYVYRYHME